MPASVRGGLQESRIRRWRPSSEVRPCGKSMVRDARDVPLTVMRAPQGGRFDARGIGSRGRKLGKMLHVGRDSTSPEEEVGIVSRRMEDGRASSSKTGVGWPACTENALARRSQVGYSHCSVNCSMNIQGPAVLKKLSSGWTCADSGPSRCQFPSIRQPPGASHRAFHSCSKEEKK